MRIHEKYLTWGVLGVSFILFTYLAFATQSSWGGVDNIVHYRIARYAFKYPELFLDLWGKPMFTILSSPFAQLGYGFMKLFNVIVSILTAFCTVLLAKKIQLKNVFFVIPAVLFSPVYFVLIPSAMTELLFGLVIVVAILFFFREHYNLTAIAISFLPFARNEGIVLIPIFILALLLKGKYKTLPLFLTGFVFFSLLGWTHFESPFWIIEQNPYTGAADIYGHGTLLHFVNKSPFIFGTPLLITFIIGAFLLNVKIIKEGFKLTESFFIALLVVGSFLTYFAAHSFVWWKGLGGALGLTRVMAGIVPLVAVISLYGINVLIKNKVLQSITAFVLTISVVVVTLIRYDVPFKLGLEEKTIKEASQWLIDSNLDERFIFYYNPVFCHYLEIDPFDNKKSSERIWNVEDPASVVKPGSLVLWDAHFGPNEGRMPKEMLLKNSGFKVINHILPEHPFEVLNGNNYEIIVFERLDNPVN